METLEECINLAINLCEGMEEYQADSKRYRDLRNKIENELYKQIVRQFSAVRLSPLDGGGGIMLLKVSNRQLGAM